MRFLVDECTGPRVARWLKDLGHTVISAYDDYRGFDDLELLKIAQRGGYMLITNDKGFGNLIYQRKENHKGIILSRLENERFNNKKAVLERLLDSYSNSLQDHFIVASEKAIRIN